MPFGGRESRVEITLSDFISGRYYGGHQEDYLAQLQAALAGLNPTVVAPYRGGSEAAQPRGHALGRGSLRRFWLALRLYWGLMKPTVSAPQIVAFHTPQFVEVSAYWLAALLRRPKGRVVALLVLRRDVAGIVGGDGVTGRIFAAMVRWLIREGMAHPASDSRFALDSWLATTGTRGSLLTIPIRKPAQPDAKSPRPFAFGLMGLFRIEKGGRYYDRIIRRCREVYPDSTVTVQLVGSKKTEEARLAERLKADWSGVRGVRIVDGHLPTDAYTEQLMALDVIVLPYDVESYGTGTSGLMFEAVALNKVVLATPIVWARAEFGEHPNVVWLDGMDPDSLKRGLQEAVRRAHGTGSRASTPGSPDRFAAAWLAAIADSQQLLDPAGHQAPMVNDMGD